MNDLKLIIIRDVEDKLYKTLLFSNSYWLAKVTQSSAALVPFIVNHIFPGSTDIYDPRAAISVLFQHCTFPAVIGICRAFPAANNTLSLRGTVIAFIAYPHLRRRLDVCITYRTLSIAFITNSSNGNARLFSAHYQVGIVLGCHFLLCFYKFDMSDSEQKQTWEAHVSSDESDHSDNDEDNQKDPTVEELESSAHSDDDEDVADQGADAEDITEQLEKLELKVSETISDKLENADAKIFNKLRLESIMKNLKRKQYKNIVVMSGAGVSTSSGIPDFRSEKTGLYDNLQEYNLPYPEAIFDIDFYRKDPRPFIRLAKTLLPGEHKPTLSHSFIKHLDEKGVLTRNYTQNIDGLELKAGISVDKLVQAHGSFDSAFCIECKTEFDIKLLHSSIIEDRIVNCNQCDGFIKPDITFFGEQLPDRFHRLHRRDLTQCDLLIVMGTSLSVYPFAGLVQMPPRNCPKLLLNRDLVAGSHFDFRNRDSAVLGDLDAITRIFIDDLSLG